MGGGGGEGEGVGESMGVLGIGCYLCKVGILSHSFSSPSLGTQRQLRGSIHVRLSLMCNVWLSVEM